MKIGHIWDGYPEKRMIIGKVSEFKYIKLSPYYDMKILMLKILERLCKKLKSNFVFFDYIVFNYDPIWDKKIDIFHSFNRIYYGRKNWVVTFENTIPAFRDEKRDYQIYSNARMKYLLNDKCKAILPMSNWAYNQAVNLWRQVISSREVEKLISKTKIMQPPQESLITYNELINKFDNMSEEVRFVFVGRDFWRKGGEIAINALKEIRKKYNVKITVISKLDIAEQAYSPKSNKDMLNYFKINSDWITYYSELPNDKVIEILKSSHIGLLPTWFDTYGFSVLEMQSTGCPVITTNTNALPEINSCDRGWFIDTQSIINSIGNDYYNKDICNKMSSYMVNSLINCIKNILLNKNEVKEKAICAYEYILVEHLPQNYKEKMKFIYESM